MRSSSRRAFDCVALRAREIERRDAPTGSATSLSSSVCLRQQLPLEQVARALGVGLRQLAGRLRAGGWSPRRPRCAASACLTCSWISKSSILAMRWPRLTRSPSRTVTLLEPARRARRRPTTVASPIRLPTTVISPMDRRARGLARARRSSAAGRTAAAEPAAVRRRRRRAGRRACRRPPAPPCRPRSPRLDPARRRSTVGRSRTRHRTAASSDHANDYLFHDLNNDHPLRSDARRLPVALTLVARRRAVDQR